MATTETAATTIRLTQAQISALECAGLEFDDGSDPDMMLLRAAWDGSKLTVTTDNRDALFSALTERANAEDAAAEESKSEMSCFARRACRSLTTLASRVLRVQA